MPFDLDQFIADCRAARDADPTHKLVREVVARAVSDPGTVLRNLGEPKRAEVQRLYHAPNLTILNVIWGPKMTIMPHNHRMWAVIGVYSGRGDHCRAPHLRPGRAALPELGGLGGLLARHRAGRGGVPAWALGLRQDHAAARRRWHRAAERRPRAHQRSGGGGAGALRTAGE